MSQDHLARIRVLVIRSTCRFECIWGQSSDGNVFVARIMQNSPEMAVDVTAKASAVGIIARNRVETGDANGFTSFFGTMQKLLTSTFPTPWRDCR